MKYLKKYLHIYSVFIVFGIVIFNLTYHYLNGSGIILKNGAYHRSVKVDENISLLAKEITSKCRDIDDICKVQNLLDYVTKIPYKVNKHQALKPLETIEKNYGDCDDKSNLLISLLKSLNYESYFVFIPKHVYVITHLSQDIEKKLQGIKSYKIDSKRFYVLESTAKNSKIGNSLKHSQKDIESIIDPFTKSEVDLKHIKYY